MDMYSQIAPDIRDLKLGMSKLRMGGYGCFIASLSMLYQKHPKEILAIPGGVNAQGLVVSGIIAKAYGGQALSPTTTPPKGWCIAITNHYAPQFPTHFFLVNAETKQQIDPLDPIPSVEPLSYRVVEYRPFTNIKFSAPVDWKEEVKRWCTDNGVITKWGTQDDENMLRVGAAIKNYHERFYS